MNRSRSESSRRAVLVMGTMAVAGALIWSKLRLATDLPRSAYAVPEPASVEPESGEPGAEQGLIEPKKD